MSGTKICKLSEVITIQNGYAFTSKKFNAEEGMPLIRIRDLKNGITTQTKYSGDYDEAYLVKSGDLLIGMDGEFRCFEWKGSPALLNQRVCRIQNINETFDLKYLYYGINSYLKAIEDVTGYTTVKHLSSSTILNIEFPIPSLEKQRDIVKKLDSTFAEIDLLEENLSISDEKANQLKQSLLKTSFALTVAEIEPGNPIGNQGFAMKIVKLSDICTFSRGLTYSKSDEVKFSNKVVLRANNIDLDSNSLYLEDLRYIKDSVKINNEKIVKKNSLIICTASGSKSHVGKVALIDKDYGFAFGGFMGQLTPTDKCHPKFLYYILTSGSFKDFLMSLNDGTNINNLKFSDIENYKIPLPSLEKQSEIVKKLDSAFAQIGAFRYQIRAKRGYVSALRQSLVSNAFVQDEGVA
jgi:type I restriction enzyme S subunit